VRANLVDEYRLAVDPLALGGGKPLFATLEVRSMLARRVHGSTAARSHSSIAGA
jgi:hypothetical protein